MPLHLNEYSNAFQILNRSRQTNPNLQPIVFSELMCYIKEFGTPNGSFIFIDIIQNIDLLFLGCVNKNVECIDKCKCMS